MEQCAVDDGVEGSVKTSERRDVVLDEGGIRQPTVLRGPGGRGDGRRSQVDTDHRVAVGRSASDSSANPQPASSTSLRNLPPFISVASPGCDSPIFHGGGPSKSPTSR